MDAIRLGLGFRALRRRRAWSQQQAADRAGVSRSAIQRIERGGAEDVTGRTLRRVAVALGEGWQAFPEVTFAIAGERGSIDVLAFHPATGALLVVADRRRPSMGARAARCAGRDPVPAPGVVRRPPRRAEAARGAVRGRHRVSPRRRPLSP
jgi:transcriptional regulator with XRE-family HTH domain